MFLWTASTTAVTLLLCVIMRPWKNLRTIHSPTFWERLIWTFKVNHAKYPFPKSMQDWDFADYDPYRMETILHAWEFLRPFFASRGYILYVKVPRSAELVPPTMPKPAPPELLTYPYARLVAPDIPPEFPFATGRVWAARDQLGRDVVLKLVSKVDKPSDEWKIFGRVNEAKLRSDLRNHTIYALDYIVFDDFVFIVMPRWDTSIDPDFSTVLEVMEYAKAWLEVLDFLHEHRIAHQDLIDQNAGINVYGSYDQVRFRKGLRNPGDVRYALYDFGHSLMYPEDIDLSSVTANRFFRLPQGGCIDGPYNPFKADVAMLGGTLEIRVRHIENIVPELGPFFAHMKEGDEDKRMGARQAYQEFMNIYSSLTPSQLEGEVTTVRWRKGEAIPKDQDG